MIRLSELKLPLAAGGAARSAAARRRRRRARRRRDRHRRRLDVFKRSFDARKADLLAVYIVDVDAGRPVARSRRCSRASPRNPHVARHARHGVAPAGDRPATRRRCGPSSIGFGPCGIFAALVLAQMGFKPIVLERGKPVRERTKDTWGLWRKSVLNPESNVQFGEGGAGTFSDGKLYSQIKDPRLLGRKVMARIRQGRRAGGNPLRRASRTSAPSSW